MGIENSTSSVSIGADVGTTVVSMDGDKPTVTNPEEVSSVDLGADIEADLEKDLADDDADPEAKPEGDDAEGEGDEGTEEGEEGDDAEALPEFDIESEEVVKAYEAKYTHAEDGTLNLDAFNAELAANEAKDGKPNVNEGSRKFLKEVYGVSDALIDRHIEGLVAIREAQDAAFYAKAGGQEVYEQMLGWATGDGGYTPAQKERFNAAILKGGEEAEEQIELLKTRFAAKNPQAGAEKTAGKRFRDRRRSSPVKQASASTATSTVKGYENQEAYRVELASVGDDPKKLADVRAKLKASKWFGQ